MQQIRIGVIGVGNMGKNHVRLTREMQDTFSLVGVCDINPDAVRKTGYDGKIFESDDALLSAVDAAVISAPSSLHKDLALKCAKHKVHALIEKPMAVSAAQAREILDAFNGTDKVLMVGHVERYNPVILEIEKIIENDEVVAICIERCSPPDLRNNDVDVVCDLMIHDIDILINGLNKNAKISELRSFGRAVYNEINADFCQALFQFDNRVIASVTASRTTEDKVRTVRIHCKNSYVEADLLHKSITISRKTRYKLDVGYSPLYRQENIVERVFVPNTESLRTELAHFADCIRTGAVCKTNGRESVKSLELVDQILQQIYDDYNR